MLRNRFYLSSESEGRHNAWRLAKITEIMGLSYLNPYTHSLVGLCTSLSTNLDDERNPGSCHLIIVLSQTDIIVRFCIGDTRLLHDIIWKDIDAFQPEQKRPRKSRAWKETTALFARFPYLHCSQTTSGGGGGHCCDWKRVYSVREKHCCGNDDNVRIRRQ